MSAPSIHRSTHRAEASEKLHAHLQRVLVALVDLHVQGKQAHWNVTGRGFRDLHLQLDELVDVAREHSDTVAERLRALQAVPDGRTETVATQTDLSPYPAGLVSVGDTVDTIVERVAQTVEVARTVHDEVDAEDPTSADLLHEIIADLEKQAWMISSENTEA
ncbi:starvation-inducible DNA-binding protein [Isoptericola sp. CG 20/1183]|uniref:Starvation-inducible DNA-binding protein n=1 Tax=Isoptericola halotolerans TaxID=300560 RepID=A0ABX5EIB7_9MICO|nr:MULTISPECIES: DNA starvation/stationary phase protection protein [Isoptericola]PRZ09421.1 starvation-inducible DNA-binding protein [Isoptericola sp. CG 20/1183]PRZ10222.1 starvation-inducible DNA-binding protein [Isoptericola halotolerans]